MPSPKKKISVLMTAFVLFISLFLIGIIWFPSILGYKTFTVETGSMDPTIKEGSMIYVEPFSELEDYQVGDIVTFTDTEKEKSFTHRIVAIDEKEGLFTTKGDANEIEDLEPVSADYAVGKVRMTIPVLGYIAMFFKLTGVKIALAVIYIAWAAIEIELFLAERKKRYG